MQRITVFHGDEGKVREVLARHRAKLAECERVTDSLRNGVWQTLRLAQALARKRPSTETRALRREAMALWERVRPRV